MANLTAFLDASVLYPAPRRDLLMELAVSDLHRAKWPNAVHEEKTVRLRLKNPPKSAEEYLGTLRAQGLLATVSEIAPFDQFI